MLLLPFFIMCARLEEQRLVLCCARFAQSGFYAVQMLH